MAQIIFSKPPSNFSQKKRWKVSSMEGEVLQPFFKLGTVKKHPKGNGCGKSPLMMPFPLTEVWETRGAEDCLLESRQCEFKNTPVYSNSHFYWKKYKANSLISNWVRTTKKGNLGKFIHPTLNSSFWGVGSVYKHWATHFQEYSRWTGSWGPLVEKNCSTGTAFKTL